MPRVPGFILGGLPIIADISFGRDGFSGEFWSEVEAIYWRKKDDTAGKELPVHIRDRAEAYDPYFSELIERASAYLAGPPDDEMVAFDTKETLRS